MEPFTLATCSTILHVFKTTCSRECAHAFQWDFSHETHFRDTFAFSQSENGLSQWCHQRIIALAANDDEFVSNIALIESVKNWKNCCILIKLLKRRQRIGQSWHRTWDCLSAGMHTLLVCTQYIPKHGKAVVSECSLTVTVPSRQSMTDGVCRVSSLGSDSVVHPRRLYILCWRELSLHRLNACWVHIGLLALSGQE